MNRKGWPTYKWENLVVGTYLLGVALAASWSLAGAAWWAQWVGVLAVFYTFQHVSVASRLEEAQDRSDVKIVECYRKLTPYLVVKELLWIVVFVLTGAWTALAGIPIFLLYPVWRRARIRRRQRALRDALVASNAQPPGMSL